MTDFTSKLIFFACLIVAVILHEISHGVVALWFGDDTAKKAGRLTLNPLPHIDPVGSLLIPGMLALSGLTPFGWARPVPVVPGRLRNPRTQMLWVGLVGPATNFVLMAGAALVARTLYRHSAFGNPFSDPSLALRIATSFALVNLVLGVFNFLPIPPLDGSSLIERVLPRRFLPQYWRFRQYGILVLFALLFLTNAFSHIVNPFQDALARFIVR